MEILSGIPVWLLALIIFGLRVVDVSLGTLRTLFVVQGRTVVSVALGFFEVLVWVTVISHVIAAVQDDPVVLFAYALGFAAGNAAGIALEKRLAFGAGVIRIISGSGGDAIARVLREHGQRVTLFRGEGRDGPVSLLFALCPRRDVRSLLALARAEDPQLFYTVEPARDWRAGLSHPLPHPTGWRGIPKKK